MKIIMNVASFVKFMSIGKSLIAESEPQSKNVKCVTNTLNSYTRNIYYAVFKFIEKLQKYALIQNSEESAF